MILPSSETEENLSMKSFNSHDYTASQLPYIMHVSDLEDQVVTCYMFNLFLISILFFFLIDKENNIKKREEETPI